MIRPTTNKPAAIRFAGFLFAGRWFWPSGERALPPLLLTCLLLPGPAVANASDLRECRYGVPQSRLAACTRLIRSGRLTGVDKAMAHNSRGLAYAQLGRHAAAVRDYDIALGHSPINAYIHNNRGDARRALKQYRPAIRDYGVAIRLLPGFALFHKNRAEAYLDLKQPEKALPDADRAIAIAPADAGARLTRARSLESLGRNQAAIAEYRRALRRDSRLAAARAGLKRLGAAP